MNRHRMETMEIDVDKKDNGDETKNCHCSHVERRNGDDHRQSMTQKTNDLNESIQLNSIENDFVNVNEQTFVK